MSESNDSTTPRAIDAGATELHVDIDGTYMNVIRFGRGPENLVVVAGVSLCGLEGQANAIAAAYAGFTDDFTVYVLDRRARIDGPCTIEDLAADIHAVLERLDVRRASFYGVSQGGMICLTLAISHPELVSRLAVCSTQARDGGVLRGHLDHWVALAKANDVVGLNRSFFELVYSPELLDAMRDRLPELEARGTAADCRRFERIVGAISGFDIRARLAEVTCPVLVLGSLHDKLVDPALQTDLAEALGCKLYLYDSYGHAVYDEAPDIKARLLDFFRDESASEPGPGPAPATTHATSPQTTA